MMRRVIRWALPWLVSGLLPALLAGCGDLPHPFQNNPGRTAVLLSRPPPSRLVVPAPADALLSNESASAWAGAVTDALVAQEIPAFAEQGSKTDWRLALTASLNGQMVVPHYTVFDPRGNNKGDVDGSPVGAAAWADGRPETLKAAALAATPQIVSLLTSIEAQREQSDPNSLLNRPARIFVPEAKGAPGDGNAALARQMRLQLPQSGEVVVPDAAQADYTVQGLIHMAKGQGHTDRVEIQWVVTDAQGREGGRIVQINEVPPGSLDLYWGDVAVAVAEQASGGVRQVVTNQLVTHRKPGAPPVKAPAS